MTQAILNFFTQFPDWLATFLLGIIPLTELRAALPLAVGFFKLPLWLAFTFSVLGNLVPAILLPLVLGPLSRWLSRKSVLAKRFFDWWFGRAVKKFSDNYQRYGEIGLMIFVAIPLPMTGAWTGAAAGFLLGIPWKRNALFVSLGVLIAGIIVAMITGGIKLAL